MQNLTIFKLYAYSKHTKSVQLYPWYIGTLSLHIAYQCLKTKLFSLSRLWSSEVRHRMSKIWHSRLPLNTTEVVGAQNSEATWYSHWRTINRGLKLVAITALKFGTNQKLSHGTKWSLSPLFLSHCIVQLVLLLGSLDAHYHLWQHLLWSVSVIHLSEFPNVSCTTSMQVSIHSCVLKEVIEG